MTFDRGDTVLDEYGWHEFARATAAHAIASTLSLPVIEDGHAVGTINLYAASPQAFTGLHDAVAAIFGAWAPGAVTNADMSFSTRDVARQAPRRLRDDAIIEMAVGKIAAAGELSIDEDRFTLREAARRGGIDEVELTRTVIKNPSGRGHDS